MKNTPISPSEFQANWKPKFFTVWGGQALSLIGSALVQFALVWYLTQETSSATVLATATLIALLPQIFLGPFVGALIDRWSRRIIMIVADTAIALATAVLMLLFFLEVIQPWHVFVLLFFRSLGGAFHHPAMTSSTSLMVPNQHLARVAGINQALQGIVTVFAPPLGALFLSLLPTQGVLAIDIGTAAFAIIPLLFIPIPQPRRQVGPDGEVEAVTSYWQDLKDGSQYVLKWPGLLGLILLVMMLNFLLSPSSALLPILVTDVFKGGASELGWVESLFGVGVILGGILLGAWGGFKRRIITSFIGVIGIGIGVILNGIIPETIFYLLLPASFLIGFAQVFANSPLHAIFQSTIAPDMQGRVFSLINAGATAMMPISLLIAGPVADALGVRIWYIIGGSICVVMAIIAAFIPAIVQIEQNQAIETAVIPAE